MDQETVHHTVKSCAVFNAYDNRHINFLINNGQLKSFPEDQTIYQKGETASGTFCLIVSGNVNVISDQDEILNTIGPGNIIGEIGTISPQEKRTITVKTAEPLEVVEWDLETIQKEVPGLYEKLRDLARDRTIKGFY